MSVTLFKNVLIFDGTGSDLTAPSNVIVDGDKIVKISTQDLSAPDGSTVIDGNGKKVLMPGLTDAHYHLNLATIDLAYILQEPNIETVKKYIYEHSADTAKQLIDMGFTCVRDAGGNTYQLKKDIDAGKVVGPRVYPSGTILCQTSGHFDFRNPCCWLHDTTGTMPGPFEFPRLPNSPPSRAELLNEIRIVDGVPEMLRATRESLMMGSSQIKIATGGGVSSLYDPIDVAEFTAEEIKACTDAAGDWNTYVMTHCFTSRSIIRGIKNGVRCIEHGFLLDEETAKLMADTGTWLSIQPILDDDDAIFPPGSNPINRAKFVEVTNATFNAYALAKKYGIKTAFGTDTLFNPASVPKEGKMLAKLCKFDMTPAEALKMATSTNAELFKTCGPRDPYPEAMFGLVKEGCFADVILVDGNPVEDINVLVDKNNVKIVMKDGKIYKNILETEK